MSGDYSESVALFSKPQSTYTGEPGEGSGGSGVSKHNGCVHDGGAYNAPEDSPSDQPSDGSRIAPFPKHPARPEPEWVPPEEESPSFDEIMCSIHEKAMSVVGFGRMQWMLYVILGLALMGDCIEMMIVAYVLPAAERELCMDDQMKGWLGAMVFAGMMFGAMIWGNIADKIGRRSSLITALITNVLFSTIAAFVPTYWLFLVCRFMSGLGIGGSIPIVYAYYSEFCTLHGRGQKMALLMIFWAFGGLYVSGLGWLIIPNIDFKLAIGSENPFGNWRIFMIICTLPIYLSVFGMLFMPESPRYLLQRGKDLDALTVYRKIYRWNHNEAGAEYEMPEIELPSRPGIGRRDTASPQKLTAEVFQALENFWNSLFQLFFPPLTSTTLLLSTSWFATLFGFYGLTIWFPEYIKKLEEDAFTARRTVIRNETVRHENFEGFLSNIYYDNTSFIGVHFHDINLQHVTFDMCLFRDVTFENVTAVKTYFVESLVRYCTFNNTNFYPSRFQGTLFTNTTLTNMKGGCQVDFDTNYSSRQVFLENFLGQLAVVPGMILTAVLIDKVGRVRYLYTTLLLSALSVFFIWVTQSETGVVIINAIFNFVNGGANNALTLISAESYPTDLRSTGLGFLSCLGRIAAILGNVTFGNFIDVSKAIPILVTAAIMAIGAASSFSLAESKNKLL